MSWEDFEKELEEKRRKEEEERLQSLKDCHEKFYRLNDGSFTYDCLVLMVCKRYNPSRQKRSAKRNAMNCLR